MTGARWPVALAVLAAACGGGASAPVPDVGEPADVVEPVDVVQPADVAPAPDLALAPDVPDVPGVPDVLDVPDVADVADVPDVPDLPDVPDVPDVPDIPEVEPPVPWRSALYPEDWTPETTHPDGHYLPDFSYAGYRYGEVEPGAAEAAAFEDVTTHGADPTGTDDATAAIQAAIDAVGAAGGGTVWVPAGLYRCDDVLTVSASHVVVRGEGPDLSRLWFTRSEGLSYQAQLTFAGNPTHDLEVPLALDGARRAHTVALEDASGLAPGDDVQLGFVITEAFVADHGMTGVWQAFNGTWQPFFWRTILAVDADTDPPTVTLDVPVRYPLRVSDEATLRRLSGGMLREVGVESLGFADATSPFETAWEHDQIHVLELEGVVDGWVRDVASFPSPGAPAEGHGAGEHLQSGGIIVRRSKRVTVSDSVMAEAQNQGGGGNGYLFEVRRSSEILFADCTGRAGRHNFIQNWGFGATGIVWLRDHTLEGEAQFSVLLPGGPVGDSEFHHSLATANLIDSCVVDDGWSALNRGDWSSGAGHSATHNVFWNVQGTGQVRSRQFAWGYVVGTAPEITLLTSTAVDTGAGTEPEDWVEGEGAGAALDPPSLYEDQKARRLVTRPLAATLE